MLIGRVAAMMLTVALTVPLVEAQEQSSPVVEVNGKMILAADDTMVDQRLLEDEVTTLALAAKGGSGPASQ